MSRYRGNFSNLLAISFGLLVASPAHAASLQPVSNWGASGVPTYISMYIYVPDTLASTPPILVVSHFCGGSASEVFGQAKTGGLVSAADKYGFIMIFPQTTNAASSAKCWDVGSAQSLTHDGGGDTQAVAQMVKYTIATYKANVNRVYATGDSSGGMMTEALLAVYPDIFKGGAAFAGVPAGCWSLGWSSASNWGGTCAGSGNPAVSSVNQTAQQWGDKVRAMYPQYTGHRPRAQLFHGDKDQYIAFTNLREGIKEWTNVLGLNTDPTSTETGLTLGTHQATRQRWKNSCGQVVLEAIASLGGDHGPSDALFSSSYVVPFLGLDQTGAVDPEVAACGAGGAGGDASTGGTTGNAGTHSGAGGGTKSSGGTTSTFGTRSSGGTPNTSGASTAGGTVSAGGSGSSSPSTGGTKATGGLPNTSGSVLAVSGGSAAGGANSTGGVAGTGTGGLTGKGGTVGTTSNGAGGSAMGGASFGTTTSLANGHGGSVGTNSATPEDNGSCTCHIGGTNNGRGMLSALLIAVCAAALRARRRGI